MQSIFDKEKEEDVLCKKCSEKDIVFQFYIFDNNYEEMEDQRYGVCDDCLFDTINYLDKNNILYLFDRVEKVKTKVKTKRIN